MNLLKNSLAHLEGVTPLKLKALEQFLGLKTMEDLLNFFPNRYVDKTQFYKIAHLQPTPSEVQIIGKIMRIQEMKQKKGSRLVAIFTDETGQMQLNWFKNLHWFQKNLKQNTAYVIFGKINVFNGIFSMVHPQMQLLSEYEKDIQPAMEGVYPSSEQLTKKKVSNLFIQNLLKQIFKKYYHQIPETLSESILKKYEFYSKKKALFYIHFPKNQEALLQAKKRLKFEELFFIQMQLLRKKIIQKHKNKGFLFLKVGNYFHQYYKEKLAFELTNAQKKVLKDIRNDLGKGVHMNRLLQGDVGSGKTIVALFCMLLALGNHFQAALLAPTEILAKQHFNFIKSELEWMGIVVGILTGSTKNKDRKILSENLKNGTLDILIGTHAILEDKVVFKNLGIVIIDEQHRFGVAQRSKMWFKNHLPPHILVMTATPIPRTLAMSVYGDLDISVIDELPKGRKPIKTFHKTDKNRLQVFKFIKDEIAKSRQIYVVYPLIEESEKMDYKDLMDGYESIRRYFPLPKYKIGVVHGKMNPKDKAYEMELFIKGETQILIATTVIEVGVNVPNASVMMIESAERFGLSQLHQLRGRIGRGSQQSYCILMSGVKISNEGKMRLQTMVDTCDGFKIAEVDLKLRGPGDMMGTQQSGILNFKIADLVKDSEILQKAREMAMQILQEDMELKKHENQNILETYENILKKKGIWMNIS